MTIINNRKFFFVLSALLVLGSIFSIYYYGLKLGIDFNGGSILEVSYAQARPAMDSVKVNVDKLDLGNYSLIPSGDLKYSLKTRELTPAEKTEVLSALSPMEGAYQNIAKEERFNSVGPVVGNQMKNKAMVAILIVIICILLFVTFVFRKVSLPVASWKYGLITIIALAHDVIIPSGMFVLYSKFTGAEVDLLFVSAILAILGYSVHDTIVVFDRVRENLKTDNKRPFDEIVGDSLTKTMSRSINTSLTTFLALLSLYFVGGEATKDFAFILLMGILVGTYSSVFVASPLLVTLEKMQKK